MAVSADMQIAAGVLNAHGIRKCVGKDDPIIVEVGANCGQTTRESSGAEDQPDYSLGWDQSGSIRRPKGRLTQYPWVKLEERIAVPIMTLDSCSKQHNIQG